MFGDLPITLEAFFIVIIYEGHKPLLPNKAILTPRFSPIVHRALSRRGPDGIHQIMYYHSGVGTGSTYIDTLTGGLLGTGISEA